jgi:hypothetical protein
VRKIIDYSKYAKKDIDSKMLFDSYRAYCDDPKKIMFFIKWHIPLFNIHYKKILMNIPWNDISFDDYCQEFMIKLIKFAPRYKDRFQHYGEYYNFVDKMTRNFCLSIHRNLQGKNHIQSHFDSLSKYNDNVFYEGERYTMNMSYITDAFFHEIFPKIEENRSFHFMEKNENIIKRYLLYFLMKGVKDKLDEEDEELYTKQASIDKLQENLKQITLYHYRWMLLKKRKLTQHLSYL